MLKRVAEWTSRQRNELRTNYLLFCERFGRNKACLALLSTPEAYHRVQVDGEPFLVYLLLRRKNLTLFSELVCKRKFGHQLMVDAQNCHKLSPLMICLLNGFPLPPRDDYDFKACNQLGHNLLHISALHGNPTLIGYALDRGIPVNSKDRQGNTALHLAAISGSLESIQLLVQRGAKSIPNDVFIQPIHQAAAQGYVEAVKFLEKRLPSQFRQSEERIYPIHIAAAHGKVEAVDYLLAANPQLMANITTKCESTPLHFAAKSDNSEVLRKLVAAGSLLNKEDIWGNTALHVAVLMEKRKAMQFLLRVNEVDVEKRNKDGLTARELAQQDEQLSSIFKRVRPQFKPV